MTFEDASGGHISVLKAIPTIAVDTGMPTRFVPQEIRVVPPSTHLTAAWHEEGIASGPQHNLSQRMLATYQVR